VSLKKRLRAGSALLAALVRRTVIQPKLWVVGRHIETESTTIRLLGPFYLSAKKVKKIQLNQAEHI
jgi:hypothetical protein